MEIQAAAGMLRGFAVYKSFSGETIRIEKKMFSSEVLIKSNHCL